MFTKFAIREIKRRKFRSVTNILSYVIAVSFLIIIVSLAQGYNVVASGELNGIGTHFVAYIPGSTTCPCELFAPDSFFVEVGPFFRGVYTPTYNFEIVETIRQLPGVEDAAPYLMFKYDNLTIGGIEVDSLATEATVVSPPTVIDGKYLEKDDLDGLMIDEIFATLLNINVNDSIHFFGKSFTVVGIVNPSSYSKPAGIANLYTHLNVVQEISKEYGELYNFLFNDLNVVLVEISPEGNVDYLNNVKDSVLKTLEFEAGKEGTIAGYQCGVKARSVVSLNENSAFIISIVLIVAATLFSLRSQFGAVVERTKEIGILKSIGWTDSDVTIQIVLEALFQGFLGGIIGLFVGYLIIIFLPVLGFVPLQNLVLNVSPVLLLMGLIISLISGIVAGIIPAWRAAKLQPAEALRHF